jgi:hypothetical protein
VNGKGGGLVDINKRNFGHDHRHLALEQATVFSCFIVQTLLFMHACAVHGHTWSHTDDNSSKYVQEITLLSNCDRSQSRFCYSLFTDVNIIFLLTPQDKIELV